MTNIFPVHWARCATSAPDRSAGCGFSSPSFLLFRRFSHVLNWIEAQKRLLLTYDQGLEMAAHQRLTEAAGVEVYFADPHSLWQREINENANGLSWQCLPKVSDLSGFTPDAFDFR